MKNTKPSWESLSKAPCVASTNCDTLNYMHTTYRLLLIVLNDLLVALLLGLLSCKYSSPYWPSDSQGLELYNESLDLPVALGHLKG